MHRENRITEVNINNIKSLCPNDMIKVVRNTLPNPVRHEIFSEMPMTAEEANIKITKKLFCGFIWEGGPYHDFIKGFGFKPYIKSFKISLVTERTTEKGFVKFITEKVFIKIKLETLNEDEYWAKKDRKQIS